jgi:hypothetical protein
LFSDKNNAISGGLLPPFERKKDICCIARQYNRNGGVIEKNSSYL